MRQKQLLQRLAHASSCWLARVASLLLCLSIWSCSGVTQNQQASDYPRPLAKLLPSEWRWDADLTIRFVPALSTDDPYNRSPTDVSTRPVVEMMLESGSESHRTVCEYLRRSRWIVTRRKSFDSQPTENDLRASDSPFFMEPQPHAHAWCTIVDQTIDGQRIAIQFIPFGSATVVLGPLDYFCLDGEAAFEALQLIQAQPAPSRENEASQ